MQPLIIGVDIDDSLNNYKPAFCAEWDRRYPDEVHLRPDELTRSWHLKECYPSELAMKVEAIFIAPSFHRNLKLKPFAREALEEMSAQGHTVFICTAARVESPWVFAEKVEWVTRELGTPYAVRTIIGNDKTVLDLDILFDDRPDIHGYRTPRWKHILVDMPCNRHVTGKPRLTDWRHWREAIRQALES